MKIPFISKLSFVQKMNLALCAIILLVTIIVNVIVYSRTSKIIENLTGEKLEAIAKSLASQIPGELHQKIVDDLLAGNKEANNTPEYNQLNKLLASFYAANNLNSDLLTIVLPDWSEGNTVFIGTSSDKKYLGNGMVTSKYANEAFKAQRTLHTPVYTDAEGSWVSAFAPIKTLDGRTVAFAEVDYHADKEVAEAKLVLVELVATSLAVALLVIIVFWFVNTREIKKAINFSTNKVKKSIGEIIDDVDQLSEGMTTLHQYTDKQITVLNHSVAGLSDVDQAADRMLKGSEEMKSAVELSNSQILDAKSAMKSLDSTLDLINAEKEKTIEILNTADNHLRDISQLFKQIQAKTLVVSDIAFQTKLISFNASVEAARAGEAGKGFSVVASEIGQLASTSEKAANEINTLMTKSLQKSQLILKESMIKKENISNSLQLAFDKGKSDMLECTNTFEKIENSSVLLFDGSMITFKNSTAQRTQVKQAVDQAHEMEQITLKSQSLAVDSKDRVSQLTHNSNKMLESFNEMNRELIG